MPRTTVLLLALAVVSCGSVYELPIPSLRETVQWLRGNLTQRVSYQCSDSFGQEVTRELHVDFPGDCRLLLSDRLTMGSLDLTTRYEVALEALDPAHHQSGPGTAEPAICGTGGGLWSLRVRATGGKKPIVSSVAFGTDPAVTSSPTDHLEFLFGDAKMATRASQALAHAIHLCGGKSDPF